MYQHQVSLPDMIYWEEHISFLQNQQPQPNYGKASYKPYWVICYTTTGEYSKSKVMKDKTEELSQTGRN